MSIRLEIDELVDTIQYTEAEIVRLEARIVEHRQDYASRLNLRSLQKRLDQLECEFEEAASHARIQVCRYRLFDEHDQAPNVRSFIGALASFQNAFSVFFAFLRSGPRERARISGSVSASSSFNLAYAFTGSLGVVLTLPRELTTLPSAADETFQLLLHSADVDSGDEFKRLADEIGIASVRALSNWYKSLREAGLGVDVDWQGEQSRERLILNPVQVQRRYNVIATTQQQSVSEESIRGTLVALDLRRRTFALAIGESRLIRGELDESIQREFRLPANYNVRLRVTETVRFSSDDTQQQYRLLDLHDASS